MASESKESKQDINLQRIITEGKNPRGIPGAKFIVSIIYVML
jgi:hypothetical protein